MGGNAVVWVTALMFALAHIGAPLSMPVLFVMGLLFGYARWASGSLYLPMFLHFVHNAAVMAMNANGF
jgi:membrane protease YdiL (CAAX protease family)